MVYGANKKQDRRHGAVFCNVTRKPQTGLLPGESKSLLPVSPGSAEAAEKRAINTEDVMEIEQVLVGAIVLGMLMMAAGLLWQR